MTEDTSLNNATEGSDAEVRIKELSNKVKLTANERDEQKKLATLLASEKEGAEKDRDFYSEFVDVVTEHPQAKDFKEQILVKVRSGYSVKDATITELVNAGKFSATVKQEAPANPAGGSANTELPPQGGSKPINEMNREEKRKALEEALKGKGWSA